MRLRYGRKEPDSMDKKHQGKSKLKNLSRKIRNTAFAVALPLIAAISGGCYQRDYGAVYDSSTSSDTRIDTRIEDTRTDTRVEDTRTEDTHSTDPTDTSPPDPCRSYNETTIVINRSTDGVIPSYDALSAEPEGVIITPELLDFVNETHALSTEGLPVEVRATLVPHYCFDGSCEGYASPSTSSFFLGFPINLRNIRVTFHEIGHLQPGNGLEVMSQINEYEQDLMGFVLFSRQEDNPNDILLWASRNTFRIANIHDLILGIYDSDFSVDDINKYKKSRAYIYDRLLGSGGNFSGLRNEYRSLMESTGGVPMDVLEAAVLDFAEMFSPAKYGDDDLLAYADVATRLRAFYFLELRGRFDEETAIAYFDANSAFPYRTGGVVDSPARSAEDVRAYGLDEFVCVNGHNPQRYSTEYCGSSCGVVDADKLDNISVKFCCFSLTTSGTQKRVIEADVVRYYDSGGSKLTVDGIELDAVDFATITYQEAKGFTEPCF